MCLLNIPKWVFFVRSIEQSSCPCCGEKLTVIGSRPRKYINSMGVASILVIRRLRCCHCNRIHHELPDVLVPYKRYGWESIEPVLSDEITLTVAADESTILRWRNWFRERANHFAGCLASISIRFFNHSVKESSALSMSVLQRIFNFVGDAPGWLARIVRPIANTNNWIHTRSAFLS